MRLHALLKQETRNLTCKGAEKQGLPLRAAAVVTGAVVTGAVVGAVVTGTVPVATGAVATGAVPATGAVETVVVPATGAVVVPVVAGAVVVAEAGAAAAATTGPGLLLVGAMGPPMTPRPIRKARITRRRQRRARQQINPALQH